MGAALTLGPSVEVGVENESLTNEGNEQKLDFPPKEVTDVYSFPLPDFIATQADFSVKSIVDELLNQVKSAEQEGDMPMKDKVVSFIHILSTDTLPPMRIQEQLARVIGTQLSERYQGFDMADNELTHVEENINQDELKLGLQMGPVSQQNSPLLSLSPFHCAFIGGIFRGAASHQGEVPSTAIDE